MLGIRMTDPVGSLVDSSVATIRPTATLREAAHGLAADSVGLLVVVGPAGVGGVLSERDVIAAIVEDYDLDEARVRDHASSDLVSVEEDVSIVDAAATMAEAQIRHIAVTRNGEVFGVVSIRDVVYVLLEQTELTET